MRKPTRILLAWIGVALATVSYGSDAAPANDKFCETRYEAIDLGTLDSFSRSAATAINNRGHVTGNSAASAFLWSCEKGLEDIGRSIVQPDNVGVALNDLDQVVILAAPEYPNVPPDAFLWERTTAPTLIGRSVFFDTESITNSGVITSANSLWSKATGFIPLELGVPIYRSHLTNLGRLGGMYFDETTSAFRLFTWTRREGLRTLGPAIADAIYTVDTNDRGDLLVDASGSDLRTAYIMSRDGHVVRVPLRPDAKQLYASHINLGREVIGSEVAMQVQPHGDLSRSFVWDPKRGFQNLDELFDPVPGNPFNATSINDWGWIVGNRRDFNASLLVPVPAHNRRFENLNRLRGPQLCRALIEVQVHRLLCASRK
jgi:hypothetical protein